jgi:hypothetical protein
MALGGNTINRELQRNGVGSRFRATTNHMENGLPENDSRPLPLDTPFPRQLYPILRVFIRTRLTDPSRGR